MIIQECHSKGELSVYHLNGCASPCLGLDKPPPRRSIRLVCCIWYKGVKLFLSSWNSPFLPNRILVDFYVLAHSLAKYGPILDFKVSVDS